MAKKISTPFARQLGKPMSMRSIGKAGRPMRKGMRKAIGSRY